MCVCVPCTVSVLRTCGSDPACTHMSSRLDPRTRAALRVPALEQKDADISNSLCMISVQKSFFWTPFGSVTIWNCPFWSSVFFYLCSGGTLECQSKRRSVDPLGCQPACLIPIHRLLPPGGGSWCETLTNQQPSGIHHGCKIKQFTIKSECSSELLDQWFTAAIFDQNNIIILDLWKDLKIRMKIIKHNCTLWKAVKTNTTFKMSGCKSGVFVLKSFTHLWNKNPPVRTEILKTTNQGLVWQGRSKLLCLVKNKNKSTM